MRLLSFLAQLYWWIKWVWSYIIVGILVGVAGAFIFKYGTTGSVTLAPALSVLLTEYAPILGGAILGLLLLTCVTWWSKNRKRAYDSFRTLKRGKNLSSPNEIAYAPVYAKREEKSETTGRELRQRPFENEYIPLPLVEWEEAKRRGIGEAVVYTDAEVSTHLQEGEYVLLIGTPTAGKTRKTFEILKEDVANRYVVVPNPETLGEGLPPEAKQFLSGRKITVVLDGLNQYANDGQALRRYLRSIEESTASCSVLGTCRDGPELERAQDRREGEPLSASGIEEVYRLFSEHRYLLKPPSVEQSREIMEGAGLNPSTLNLDEYRTPGDLLLEDSKREMRERFKNDLSPQEQDLLHATQLLDQVNVEITHQRLRRTVQEAFGRDRLSNEAAFEDALARLERLGFIALPSHRDPVVLERAYAGLEKGAAPYPAGRTTEEDVEDLITVFDAEGDSIGLFRLGNYFYDRERYSTAIETYGQAVEADPSLATAWSNRGVALQKQGRLDDAIDNYDRAVETDPSNTIAWYNRGIVLEEQGHLDDALDSYDRAVEADPFDAMAWYNRGNVLAEQDRLEDAIESFDQAIEADPSHAGAWCNKGIALVKLNRLNDALRCFDRAIEADPSNTIAWYNRGKALDEQGRLDDALDSYDRAIEIDPSYAMAWYNRGNVLVEQDRLEEALESYERAVDADPSHAEAWSNRGNVLVEQDRLEDALESFDQAIEADPSHAGAWSNRGNALRNQGRLDDALDSYNRAIEADSSLTDGWYNRGIALEEQGRLEDALESYDRAIEIDPSMAKVWSNRGIVLARQNRLEDALESFDRAIEVDPSHAEAWSNRGNVLKNQGRLDDALDSYNRAIEAHEEFLRNAPDHVNTYKEKGSVLSKRADVLTRQNEYGMALEALREAIGAYSEVLQRTPDDEEALIDNGDALRGFANVLVQKNEYERALEAYQKAIEAYDEALAQTPDYPRGLLSKADAFCSRGQLLLGGLRMGLAFACRPLKDAKNLYNRVLQIEPGHTLAQERVNEVSELIQDIENRSG